MNKNFKYLNYVLRHKFFVLRAALKVNASLWRCLVHDLSKFSPMEWQPYVEWFYGQHGRSFNYGVTCDFAMHELASVRFKQAWNHHQKANKHHHQYWLLRGDDGSVEPLEIPEVYVREMIADWMGAGRAITGKWDVQSWYDKNSVKIVLHPKTRMLVEEILQRL